MKGWKGLINGWARIDHKVQIKGTHMDYFCGGHYGGRKNFLYSNF
jgi:hypothetical protein